MTPLKHNTYLCTGAAGFIGSHLTEQIVKQGKKVIAVDNLINGKIENLPKSDLCEFWPIDVRNVNELRKAMQGVDVVFHNAASKCTVCRTNPYLDLDVNAKGSFNVFQAAIESGVKKVVHASTGSVYGLKSFYGISKQAGESYLKAFKEYHPDFCFTCLRYFHVIGTRQDNSPKGGVVPIFIRQALNDESITIFGDGKQIRHFTSVTDVVSANFYCANNDITNSQYYDVVSGIQISINDLADLILKLTNKPKIKKYFSRRLGDINSFTFTNIFDNINYNNDIEDILIKICKG
jgi:nucleoside-diphosphate-sugar epimerase